MKKIILAILMSLPFSLAMASSGGFLKDESPDSAIELPPPPSEGSKLFSHDRYEYRKWANRKGSKRWLQAISDSDMSQDNLEKFFSGPMDENISRVNTPSISKIIDMMRYDAGYYSTVKAKEKYKRKRPFSYFKSESCTPQKDHELSVNGSYPSGHAATAWAVALVLSEVKPSRKKQLINAAYNYGESRVVCGAHWESDVVAGRKMGDSLFSKINNNTDFVKIIKDAKKEVSNEG